MSKSGSWTWYEHGFENVVDSIDQNVLSRMINYNYKLLLQGKIVKNIESVDGKEGIYRDEVIDLGLKSGSWAWYEHGFENVVDEIDQNWLSIMTN